MKPMQDYFSRLVHEIDCCQDHDPTRYFESHPTVIRDSAVGRYRECAATNFSRFAYRFTIDRVQRPHVYCVSYPDNKERTFCIMDGRASDLSTGIATGREMPISGKMLTHKVIFWPRWTDCTLMFITWDGKAPAAVAKIQVYELDEQFFEDYSGPPPGDGFRQIGFKWEDPGGRYVTMGAVRRPDWSRRVAAYASAMAQTVVQHPITWYWGCLYPSDVDDTDYLEGIVDDKSTAYISPVHTTYDWVAETIEDLGRKGIQFMGVFHAYRFHNLLRAAQRDGSLRNVNSDGTTQLSTLDWTRTWTRFNIPRMAASENYKDDPEHIRGTAYECTNGMKEIPSDILGEPMGKLEGFCAPIFNCLHPAVEKHLLALMTELKKRYGRYRNFKGITIPLWGATFLWYGSLRTGYDDLTFSRFERENQLDSGISADDPDRYARRFQWVTANHKQEWIDWRCRSIKGLVVRMRKALAGDRDDVKVVISAWREPLLSQILTSQEYHAHLAYDSEPVQLCNSGGLAAILREGGIDPVLYDGRDGVEIELQNDPYRDRSLEIARGPTPMSNALRDHDFLDRETNALFARPGNRNVFIFNAYYESGRYVIGNAEPGRAQVLRDYGSGVGELYKVYLVFDHPTWPWFEREHTTCPGVPAAGRNFLEYYAHAVAVMDAKLITFGGLLIGCYGHDEDLREFSRAFTYLPAEPFDTVPANSDAVVVRSLSRGDRTYMYIVNSEPAPMQVRVSFSSDVVLTVPDAPPISITGATHTFPLQPYELQAYHMPSGKPVSAHVQLTEELIGRMEEAKAMLKRMTTMHQDTKWYTWLLPELEDCIRNARHSRLRHVFRSYPVQKLQSYP